MNRDYNQQELLKIKNLGVTMLDLLNQLNIFDVNQLKLEDPISLYFKISSLRGQLQDAKMFDMCTAIIYSAKTGQNTHWSEWTKTRVKKYKKLALMDIIQSLINDSTDNDLKSDQYKTMLNEIEINKNNQSIDIK